MNILLIAPPVFDFYNTPHRMEPLGLEYIQKAFQNAGYQAEIYDSTASGKVKKQQAPNELKYLYEFYEEDHSFFSLHNGYKRFGDSFRKICEFVSSGSYDFIGVSSLFSAYHPDVENLVAEIKKVYKNPVVIGGTAIGAQPEFLYGNTSADYLIHGCGTVSMVQFADAMAGKIPFSEVKGLIYRNKEKVVVNAPSKKPAWEGEIIPNRGHLRVFRGRKIAKTVFSCGCRNRCSFCSIHRDNDFAQRNIRHIERELEFLLKSGAKIIDIEDDDIFSDNTFALDLLALLGHFHSQGLEFTALNGLTAKNIVPFADKLHDAGFIRLDLSLVSGSGNVTSKFGRPHGIAEIEKIREVTGNTMELEAFIIPGLPGTTFQETLNTMLHLYRTGIKCGLSPLYLVPGVPMFEKIGIPEKLRLCRGSAIYPFTAEQRADIAALLKISRFINHSLADPNALLSEDREYFEKSLLRKQWYKKTSDGKWFDSFRFYADIPDFFNLD